MADGVRVARTPRTPQRRLGRWLPLLVLITVLASACSATPSWTSIESETATAPAGDGAPDELAFVDPDGSGATTPGTDNLENATVDQAVVDQALVDGTADEAESEPAQPSADFCTASANIWIHSGALNLLGGEANDEMTRIAMANVAEWIERSTLFDEPAGPDHTAMFEAFTELQTVVESDFDYDWVALQSSSTYANSDAAQTYEASRSELVTFLNDSCDDQRMVDLRAAAEARADELTLEFQAGPSTIVESDSLPGHSIFTHSGGRLIASFPTAWAYEERTGTAIAELIASPDIERFLAGEAIDGVHLQLVEAPTIDNFRDQLDATMTASTCLRTNNLSDTGVVRQNITQTFSCSDHGASIMGQYSETRGLGLIIEASFDRPDASRADLIRLASIANSALWS